MRSYATAITALMMFGCISPDAYGFQHSQLGRFVQRDRVGYPDGMNLAEYVGGNPTNWVDPIGDVKQARRLAYLCCDGSGHFAICITDDGKRAPECARSLIIAHEESHKRDWEGDNIGKQACIGRKQGDAASVGKDKNFKNASEKRAYEDSYRRATDWLKKNTNGGDCSSSPIGFNPCPIDWKECCDFMKDMQERADDIRRNGDPQFR